MRVSASLRVRVELSDVAYQSMSLIHYFILTTLKERGGVIESSALIYHTLNVLGLADRLY